MIYSNQPLQQIQPNLSSQQQASRMQQGSMQTQGRPLYSNSAEGQPIRPIAAGGRVPQYGGTVSYITSAYTQGQPTEATSVYPGHGYHVQQPSQFMQSGMQPFQGYGNMNYAQRNSQFPPQPVYVVQQANYASNVVLAAPMQANQSHQIQNSPRQPHNIYPQMTNVHTSQPAINMMAPPEQPSQQKKRTTIKLVDPNTGKDLTSEILKKKEKVAIPPAPTPDESIKAKTAAKFAAQVAEKIAEKNTTMQPEPQVEAKKPSVSKTEEKVESSMVLDDKIIEKSTAPKETVSETSAEVTVCKTTEEVEPLETSDTLSENKLEPVETKLEDHAEPSVSPEIKEDENKDAVDMDQEKETVLPQSMHVPKEDTPEKSKDVDVDQKVIPPEDGATISTEQVETVECKDTPDTKTIETTSEYLTQELPANVDAENVVPEKVEVDVKVTLKSVEEVEPETISLSQSEDAEIPVTKEEVEEEIVVVEEVLPTETVPEVQDADTVEKEVKDNLEKQEQVEFVAKEEVIKNEKNVKTEKNKNEKPLKKEEVKPVKKEEPLKKEIPPVKKELNIKKEPENVEKEKDLKKKTEKKDQTKTKDNVKKETITKDAIKRFEPSFSTGESIKNAGSKPKEPVKPKEPAKSKEPVKSVEPTKTVETAKSVEPKKAEPMINSHDDSVKFTPNPVMKKKKGKLRYKDFDAKDAMNNDMLSAFVDAPTETVTATLPEPVKATQKPPEETTWEDKESSIEKEDICGEDADEELVVPKKVETKIIKSEDSAHNDEKHQYDREFLLKFQFAPICTSKPANLPNIDIVLDEAHAPTKALVPGQRISAANDFMPTFMGQSSGGRNSASGSRGSRDRKGGSQSSQPRQQKILHVPQFEKIELKKAENAWVRPSAMTKDMGDEERGLFEVNRAVCSILNKLTPQKFKPLVNQMIALKIDNSAKLESAIATIFEKAISEPGFSVAYANMCRVLTDQFNKVPVSNEPGAQVVTFRKILLNKCQTEFEKETSDEKQLALDRSKTFDTEEARKSWIKELDYRERMNRRRMLGNIRFIGELYKLKMISEPIMHDCIYKLLRAEKQDSLEDQLECLCKLLTTIGKDLDHQKAKPRMDQYFDQMEKVIEKRKISSRIKFALKDVIELRAGNWVPRRDEANPKTIDQIHREAEQKEKESDMARQQDKLQRKLEPKGGRGGRGSPSVRGPPGVGGSSDGWNTVPNKSRAMPAATVDASKFKALKKTDTSEISLGPGGRAGAWSKGASGGGSRSGSGSNTPTSEIDSRMNRYDVLTDSSVAPGVLDNKRSGSRQGIPPRKGMSGGHGSQQGSRHKSDREEQNAALHMVRDMTGRSSRNQSPGRSSRNQSPVPPYSRDSQSNHSSRGQTPVVSPNPVTTGKMRKVTKSTVEEYISCKDDKEAILCIKELDSPGLHNIFVEEALLLVIEKKAEQRRIVGTLLHRMMRENIINLTQMCQGFASIVELAPDFSVDIPLIYKYVGEVLGPIVYDGTLPLNKVKDNLEPLIQQNKAGIVMAEALSSAVQIAGKEELISLLWSNSKLTWEMMLSSNENVQQFIKDKKMEFTLKPSHQTTALSHNSQSATLNHASQIQEMLRILNGSQKHENNNENTDLINYIEQSISPGERKTPSFIQALTTAVCTSSISKDNNCECNKELLRKRKNVLLKYIDRSKDLELQALFALQQLVNELKQPKGLLNVLFEELYDGDIITEDAFFTWEKSKECPHGKGHALSSVKDFLSWLKKADEESNDEESSTSPTNVA